MFLPPVCGPGSAEFHRGTGLRDRYAAGEPLYRVVGLENGRQAPGSGPGEEKPARLVPAAVENSVDAVGNSTNRGVVINLLHKIGNVKQINIIKPRFVGYAENCGKELYTFYKVVVKMHRIKDLRVQRGMKQSELAQVLKCSPTTVSNYEVGIRDIDSETVCKLCDVFGCTADYLLGRSELPNNEISDEEAELVLAFRGADDRAREMVRLALAPFTGEATTAASAK